MTLNWGTGIALVYTGFALATTGFVAFAMARPVDLVSTDYYARSLKQDERIAAERNALALRPEPTVIQTDGRTIALSLPSEHAGRAHGTVTLYRPSDARADRVMNLQLDASGAQRLDLAGMATGRWILQVAWSVDGRQYYVEHPVFVR